MDTIRHDRWGRLCGYRRRNFRVCRWCPGVTTYHAASGRGLPAGEVGAACCGVGVAPTELFVLLLAGAPPPTAPDGAPPPTAPAGAPPPTAFPPPRADVPVPPWPPPAPAAPAPPAPEPAPPPPPPPPQPPWASATPIGNISRRAIAAVIELRGMGTPLKLVLQRQPLALVPVGRFAVACPEMSAPVSVFVRLQMRSLLHRPADSHALS